MADGASIRTWTFGGGFNNDRSVPSPVIIRPPDGSASVDYFDIRLARILGTATTSITSQ